MRLRPYQRRAVDSIARCLADAPSTLLVLPTGCGKTVVCAHAIREVCTPERPRAMVIAHREELIGQNARTIERVVGEPCDIEMADRHADLSQFHRAKVIVASKDSLHARRLERFDPSEFGLLVVDECHHATTTSNSYARVIEHFAGNGARHLGVTATPNRHDREALGSVYETAAMVYGIADAIRDGWLVPIRARSPIVRGLNLDDLRTVAGDLDQAGLSEQLERDRPIHEVCSTTTEVCGDRRALVFTVSVRQAELLADALNNYRHQCARSVSGTTPREERAAIIAAHKAGEFQYLCQCNIATEGYDDPGIGVIVMARPTKSLPLFMQMIGRGTRPVPGLLDTDGLLGDDMAPERRAAIESSEKPSCLILNFTSNCSRHKLITPVDVLGGRYSDADRAAVAAAMLDAGEDVDVGEELSRAEREREQLEANSVGLEERALYAASRAKIVAQARYLMREEDLFDCAFAPGRERAWLGGKGPTENQVATLERHGFRREDILRMSRNECSRLIGGIVLRVQRGLCTIKQAAALTRGGVAHADSLTFEAASAMLDRMYGGRPRAGAGS